MKSQGGPVALRYDRRVSEEFLAHFVKDGVAASLADYARHGLFPLDVRLRRDPKSNAEHATLYVGLTAVLNVHRAAGGKLRLKAHPTHLAAGKFRSEWLEPRTPDELRAIWAEVELYLDRVIPLATQSHGRTEGAVQAAVANHRSTGRVVLDREVTPSFQDKATKAAFMEECQRPLLDALDDPTITWSGRPTSLGNECDALAVTADGRVLAIEVKPWAGGSVAWVAAQAAMYARILQRWVDAPHDGDGPREVLTGMLEQRRRLRLAPALVVELAERPQVVPVVALQRGASAEMIRRMKAVLGVVNAAPLGIEPVEIYEVNLLGELLPLDDSRTDDGAPLARRSYVARANARAERWKATEALPVEARELGEVTARTGRSAKVAYALPREYAAYNLLPEVREPVMALFRDQKISWHQGVDGGPTNHLRSSQVQCLNALGQMMADPERIASAFGGVLDIGKIRDLGEIDPRETGRHLTFEFTGPTDYLHESRSGVLTRGAHSTSVDAAFAYRTADGVDALALVEWKFTESYPSAVKGGETKEEERRRRYGEALTAEDGPVDVAGLELGDLFHDPIYQLVRQQLLARALERDPAIRADHVAVVHVLSPDNDAYQRSYVAPALRGRGATVDEVWQSLLRPACRDRFRKLDPAVFLDPAITSAEYVARYGDPDE